MTVARDTLLVKNHTSRLLLLLYSNAVVALLWQPYSFAPMALLLRIFVTAVSSCCIDNVKAKCTRGIVRQNGLFGICGSTIRSKGLARQVLHIFDPKIVQLRPRSINDRTNSMWKVFTDRCRTYFRACNKMLAVTRAVL